MEKIFVLLMLVALLQAEVSGEISPLPKETTTTIAEIKDSGANEILFPLLLFVALLAVLAFLRQRQSKSA